MAKSQPRHAKKIKIKPDHFDRVKDNTHILYRLYSSKNMLLYVGMTNDLEKRLKEHRRSKPWYIHVAYIEIEHFDDRKILAKAESDAILSERPVCNIQNPLGGKRASLGRVGGSIYPDASKFCTVQDDEEGADELKLEQILYPCMICHARAIGCEGNTVACRVCESEWTFADWFAATFQGYSFGKLQAN